jgi:hypothetical protein
MRQRRDRKRVWLWGAFAVFAACSFPSPAVAHSLNVECRVTPDALEVVVSFGRGKRPAKDAAVELRDVTGAVVTRGQSDAAGVCRLNRPGAGRYRLSADAHEHETEVEVVVPEGGAQAAGGLSTSRPPQPSWHSWIPWFVFAALGIMLAVCWRWARRVSPRSDTALGLTGHPEDAEPGGEREPPMKRVLRS